MRLTTVILIAGLMQVSAAGLAQKLTYAKKNVTLEQVFAQIEKQTGYKVLYSDRKVDDSKKISVNFNNTSLKEVMDFSLKGLAMTYEIDDKTIVVKRKELSILDNIIARFQVIDISGRVVGEDGQPLIGATVSVKGGGKTTQTDKEGNFKLTKLNENSVLQISYIGYLNKEVNANADLSKVILEVSNSKLDEVQVIAYGTTTKRLSTGNTSTVKAEDIARSPVSNPLLSLSGRVPGLIIEQSSGFSNSGIKVTLQGQNSIFNGNDPFYVIDGVPYISQLLPNLGGILGNSARVGSETNFGNPLSFLNSSDIESIDVLKDADATAIYGSRAANGAILITTKKGKAGQTKIGLNLQKGIGNVENKLKLLSTQQYLEMRKEGYQNDGTAIPTSLSEQNSSNYDLTLWDQSRERDWQEYLIGNNAKYTDAKLSISGGNSNTQFLVGGGYHKETTVFPGSLADKKGSLHFNLTNTSNNQKFRFTLTGSYLSDVNHLINFDLTEAALRLSPNAPELLNQDESINWGPDQNGNSSLGFKNPLAELSNKYTNKTNNLIGNSNLSYTLSPSLNFLVNLGYTNMQTDEIKNNSINSYPPEYQQIILGSSLFGRNKLSSWIIEPQINYNKNFRLGRLTMLLGATAQQNNNDRALLEVTGYSNDLLLDNPNGGASSNVPENSTIVSVYKYNAIFARANYNVQDKYILNLTARRDGSSRFGSENRFHNFGAIGAAWIISEEGFIKRNISFLSFGKIRASYGNSGNDQIGDYKYLSLFNPITTGVPYRGGSSLSVGNLANPLLQWEESTKLSAGLDIGFINDRILFNTTYFRTRSSSQLLPYSLPIITGFGSITSNFPATVQNSGWEIALSIINVNKANFKWSTNFNITLPKNELVAFPNLETSSYYSIFNIGQAINRTKVYDFEGVDPATGLYQFRMKDGQLTVDPGSGGENRIIFINTTQKFYGGIKNNLTYKEIQLDFLFQYAKQLGTNNIFGVAPGLGYNQPINVLDRWQKKGDIKPIQRYNSDGSLQTYGAFSNAGWSDASYIRLKNISLSWQFPDYFNKRLKIQNVRVYAQGQNLFTITNFKGLDPETKSSTTLPPLRMLTVGFQLTF